MDEFYPGIALSPRVAHSLTRFPGGKGIQKKAPAPSGAESVSITDVVCGAYRKKRRVSLFDAVLRA